MKLIERANYAVVDIYVAPSTAKKLGNVEFIALNDYSMGEPIPEEWPKPIHNSINQAINLGAELLYIKVKGD